MQGHLRHVEDVDTAVVVRAVVVRRMLMFTILWWIHMSKWQQAL